MAEIAEDLIVKILLLLPVAALLRFRCVSKRWRDIIDSPYFVKSHLNLSNNKKAHSLMIFCEKTWPYYIEFDSIRNDSSPPILKELTIKPWYGDARESFGVVGACNGLVCLYTTHCVVVLWNPLIGKHFQFALPQQLNKFYLWCWGFGYDSDSDDYKVVCIALSENGDSTFVLWVYSLNSGSWKSIGDFPPVFLGQNSRCLALIRQNGVFVNGALHWRLHPHYERDCSDLVVALDLGKLEFYLVPHPDFRYKDMWLNLGVLDGCLFAISYNYGVHGFDLWVMTEYGVKESWTKLVTCTAYASRLTPLAYTENGDELLFVGIVSNVIVRYEFETRSFKRMTHCNWSPELGKPLVYIPSLVCPRSGVLSGNF